MPTRIAFAAPSAAGRPETGWVCPRPDTGRRGKAAFVHALVALIGGAWAGGLFAHHPVGIPQYREQDGAIVLFYNVQTQDYVVHLKVSPGRPQAESSAPIRFTVDIEPRDPAVVFPGDTFVSVAQDQGDRGQIEIAAPVRRSGEAGKRSIEVAAVLPRPGKYLFKVDFTESPGREVLDFPVIVEARASGARRLLPKVIAGFAVLAAVLLLQRSAARRRRRAAGGAT